jgi:3-isopropylmalate/(R)-2-methylmalate dehydratase small subunit
MNTLLEGRVWVVGDSVNTDAMYPGYAMKMSLEEAAKEVFYDLRPGWTDQVEPGDILIAGQNFGVGSSRSVAHLFRLLGVQAFVADQFNALFYRNSINFGMPALTVAGAHDAFSDGDIARIEFAQGWVENLTTGRRLEAAAGLPPMVLDILDAGGLMQQLTRRGFLPA